MKARIADRLRKAHDTRLTDTHTLAEFSDRRILVFTRVIHDVHARLLGRIIESWQCIGDDSQGPAFVRIVFVVHRESGNA